MNRLNSLISFAHLLLLQSSLVVKLEVGLADPAYSLGHIRFHPGIVQQDQGHSAEIAVSPHHNYQSMDIFLM
jgi:hypothetical protein